MKKETKEIIVAIFGVSLIILSFLGYWYSIFIFLILLLSLPKTREEKAESLKWKLLFHLFQKRDWKDKEKVKQQLGKELEEMKQISDEIEKE
ncbi:hypothetical protein KGQ34_00295 [Patescibacteria group bacterium]|nr:hypothetical protein [Patescibacteria group bacterium]